MGITESKPTRFGLYHPAAMSYRKIISVVNEQTASTVMARYAISLSTSGKAALVLYAAHDMGGDETVLRHTERHLEHLLTVASGLDIPVTRITEVGDIGNLLPARVLAEKADLVFYPLLPHERYGANMQRQTVHHLLRTIKSDLAIMRVVNMARPHPRHILMPLGKIVTDKEHRLMFIAELARSFHAQVTLFHLTAEHEAQGMPDDIALFRQYLQQHDVTVLERSGKGQISKSITVEAITRHHDLIILGASERGVLQRMFYGNPAGDVMHQAPCNAILFRSVR
jgi:nucleotide-binding universal stress UspA family protein